MNIEQNFKSGKVTICIQGMNFTALFPRLAAQPCTDFPSLNAMAQEVGIRVYPFSSSPKMLQGKSELGFIDGGFMCDRVILYKDFFAVAGIQPFLAYYSQVAPVKSNVIEGQYYPVQFSGPEKAALKDIFKTSIANFKASTKQQVEDQETQYLHELQQKLSSCLISTTPSLEGFSILQYHGTVSAFSILKLDIVQEFFANLGDIWGGKSKGYMKKFQDLQNDVEGKLKFFAIEKGANAVIGANFDVEFIETSTGRKELLGTGEQIDRKMIVSGSGTAVTIERKDS